MSNQLFIDLSAEQQEVVAGGLSAINIGTSFLHTIQNVTQVFPVVSSSGKNGSLVASGGAMSSYQELTAAATTFKGLAI